MCPCKISKLFQGGRTTNLTADTVKQSSLPSEIPDNILNTENAHMAFSHQLKWKDLTTVASKETQILAFVSVWKKGNTSYKPS